jgi:DtxR family Mn-dependent transcriptional regulator
MRFKEPMVTTRAMEDYLKAIYALERRGAGAGTSSIARRLHVAPASVTSMLRRLARLRLAAYARYRGVRLTPSGRRVARAIMRRHKLIRTLLAERFGVSPQEAGREADLWEHALSPRVEARIAATLSAPRKTEMPG